MDERTIGFLLRMGCKILSNQPLTSEEIQAIYNITDTFPQVEADEFRY